VAGGMMAVGIPEYRLPRDILAAEIKLIEQMGVEIRTNVAFGKDITFESLKADGYAAVFLAVGLHNGRRLGVENEDADGVLQGVDFLRDAAMGKDVSIGEEVLVIGGGNVAVDVALTAKRKGAKNVTMVCLEKREEMPAWEHEIREALESEIKIVNSFGPKSFFIDQNKRFSGIEFKTCTAVFDENGRFSPTYDESACQAFFGNTLIVAIGQSTNTEGLKEQGVPLTRGGGLDADPVTLQTSLGWVFAGGDALYGPKSVVDAVACGKEAAESIHRYINNMDLTEGRQKEWIFEKPDVIGEPHKDRVTVRCLDPRPGNAISSKFPMDTTRPRPGPKPTGASSAASARNATSASRPVWPTPSITTSSRWSAISTWAPWFFVPGNDVYDPSPWRTSIITVPAPT
jgi:NADPH-dependent glutamate synthase beta subunit-like oxidoreductase